VKKLRVISKRIPDQDQSDANDSNCIVFYEKSTGLAHVRLAAEGSHEELMERLASTLAMQCLVRGSEPDDFAILVPAEGVFAGRLVSRAQELLEEGRALALPVSLSPRQREVLAAVTHNRSNKEIASKLNVTVRTVKFHISSLLAKFGVENRAELAQRATALVQPESLETVGSAIESSAERPSRRELKAVAVGILSSALRIAPRKPSGRYLESLLPA